ncbi:hypothetical protein BH23BAC1_BH23BAC1_50960 [soil metagenome]
MNNSFILLFFIIIYISGCRERISIEGFNEAIWKSDLMGCNGARENLISILSQEKDELMGLSENRILQFLGKPDFQELYERNQKFYYYYFIPGPQCQTGNPGTNEGTLQIRFTALGFANEIVINN